MLHETNYKSHGQDMVARFTVNGAGVEDLEVMPEWRNDRLERELMDARAHRDRRSPQSDEWYSRDLRVLSVTQRLAEAWCSPGEYGDDPDAAEEAANNTARGLAADRGFDAAKERRAGQWSAK